MARTRRTPPPGRGAIRRRYRPSRLLRSPVASVGGRYAGSALHAVHAGHLLDVIDGAVDLAGCLGDAGERDIALVHVDVEVRCRDGAVLDEGGLRSRQEGGIVHSLTGRLIASHQIATRDDQGGRRQGDELGGMSHGACSRNFARCRVVGVAQQDGCPGPAHAMPRGAGLGEQGTLEGSRRARSRGLVFEPRVALLTRMLVAAPEIGAYYVREFRTLRIVQRIHMKPWLHPLCCLLTLLAVPAGATVYDLPDNGTAVFGSDERIKSHFQDTLLDIARRYSLGYEEIIRANPGVDMWLPGEGMEILLPGRRILPAGPREGVVVNLPEHRLYYFPKTRKGEKPVVITFPVSIGKMDWHTPLGETRVIQKQKHPAWYPPEGVRKE